jgi:hypothetical protein
LYSKVGGKLMMSHDGLCLFWLLDTLVERQDMPKEELRIKPDIPRVGLEGGRVPPEVETEILRARGDGHSLNGPLQEQMSACLGHDFGDVRVHTGPEADQLNRHLGATAFTTGLDIFFRRGAYDPASRAGRELIAHELVHVVQQRTGRATTDSRRMTVRPAGDACEREASALAKAVAASPIAAAIQTPLPATEKHDSRRKNGCDRNLTADLFGADTEPAPWQMQETLPLGHPVPFLDDGQDYMVSARERGARCARRNPTVQSSLTIQRTADTMAEAANTEPPTVLAATRVGDVDYWPIPSNCHEFALGCLIRAHPYNRPWNLLALIKEDIKGKVGWGLQRWLWGHIYHPRTALNRATIATAAKGDILVLMGANLIEHSMIVVSTAPVKIRGFNNLGTFGECNFYDRCRYNVWDQYTRTMTKKHRWHANNVGMACPAATCKNVADVAKTRFGHAHAQSLPIHRVVYADADASLAAALSHYQASAAGLRWEHSPGPCAGGACPRATAAQLAAGEHA